MIIIVTVTFEGHHRLSGDTLTNPDHQPAPPRPAGHVGTVHCSITHRQPVNYPSALENWEALFMS